MAFEKKMFEKVQKARDKRNPKAFVGFLPKKRVFALIRAMEENLEALNVLSNEIEAHENVEFRRKSLDFRLFIYLLQAVFRLNSTQVEIVLSNSLNTELSEFIAEFSPETTISQQEISDMQGFFANYKAEIVEAAWAVKRSYHEVYATMSDETFLELIDETGRKVAYSNVDKLECVDFTRFYPDQLLPEETKYPDDLMLKCVIYGKLANLRSTFGLAKELNRPWELTTGGVDFMIARGLGFYIYHPGKDKIYDFMNTLSEAFLEEMMLSFTETLIQIGLVDPRQIMIDSTSLHAREDDPDIAQTETKRGSPSRCYKVQILCDLEQTPLLVLRRPGEENDLKGFENCIPRLLRIKNTVEQCGLRFEYFIADAGYFDRKTIAFVQQYLEAKFILDINPRQSTKLNRVKDLFTEYRTLSRKLAKKHNLSETERQRVIHQLYRIIKRLKQELQECKKRGNDFEQNIAKEILSLGVENYLLIYRRRSIIEGLIGHLKEHYYLAGKTNSKLQIKGTEKVGVHCLLIFIAVQISAMTRYRLLRHNVRVNQDLFGVKLSEFALEYEIKNG